MVTSFVSKGQNLTSGPSLTDHSDSDILMHSALLGSR